MVLILLGTLCTGSLTGSCNVFVLLFVPPGLGSVWCCMGGRRHRGTAFFVIQVTLFFSGGY
ncbi:exported hypothetical protein [Cupriavidus taiwanensis]|nr:exported hypothetical protein [Cupriavidus taiwanensis]